MATNTVYLPASYPIDASKVQGYAKGLTQVCGANTTTNIDLTFTDDAIITGAQIITSGMSLGDYLALSVLSGGTTVLNPVPGPWYLPVTNVSDFDFVMPVKILAGLTLRVSVTTTVLLNTPFVAVNYKLWKVLS